MFYSFLEQIIERGASMDALEKYYQDYLMNYSQDSNFESYDVDAQMTKERVESILDVGFMIDEDVEFIRSLLPDIENERIRAELEEYIERLMII